MKTNIEYSKVVSITDEGILFDSGITLCSSHDTTCCEKHYLSFSDLELSDFDDLIFNLSSDSFFKRIEGYGIELIPTSGYSVRIPGYAWNNGHYLSDLTLVLINNYNFKKEFIITECQSWEGEYFSERYSE